MIDDLKIDPLERGTAVLDVNRVLLFDIPLNSQINYFLYHVCSVGNALTNFTRPNEGNQIHLLESYLRDFFPADHLIAFVSSKTVQSAKSKIEWFKLENLSLQLSAVTFDTTLFVPSVKPKKINQSFLEALMKSKI